MSAIDWKARAEKAEAELALCRTRLGVAHDTEVSEAIRVSRLGEALATENQQLIQQRQHDHRRASRKFSEVEGENQQLRAALVQANDVAEDSQGPYGVAEPGDLATMRANLARWSK